MAGSQVQLESIPTPPIDQQVIFTEPTSRFGESWKRWFLILQKKLNTINGNLVGLSEVSGSGVIISDGSGGFTTGALSSNGGITCTYGVPGGTPISGAPVISGIATANYALTGWSIECSPSGSIILDVQQGTLGASPATIVGSGNGPEITSSTFGNAGTLTGWTSLSIVRGDNVAIVVTSVSGGVEWFTLSLFGTRS